MRQTQFSYLGFGLLKRVSGHLVQKINVYQVVLGLHITAHLVFTQE